MSRNYARGAGRERQVQERLEEDGWVVTRSAGSRSPHDLHCSRRGETMLVQVKSCKAGPYAHFGPAERETLLASAKAAHASAFLVHWPADRKPPRWIHSDFWP